MYNMGAHIQSRATVSNPWRMPRSSVLWLEKTKGPGWLSEIRGEAMIIKRRRQSFGREVVSMRWLASRKRGRSELKMNEKMARCFRFTA